MDFAAVSLLNQQTCECQMQEKPAGSRRIARTYADADGSGVSAPEERAPRISVVMAVYNGERYLREAIESVLGQTYGDFEFLIIDDGSTDGTREIINSYEDPRIRLVVNEQNLGLTPSLNRGLRLARGEFIARQDADDISEPERFARQIAFLEEHSEVALLGTQCTIIDSEGTPLRKSNLPFGSEELRWELLFYTPFSHTSVMLRRETVLGTIGLYDESYQCAQDTDYWIRIARSLPVANLRDCLVRYRYHAHSMVASGAHAREGPLLRVKAIEKLLPGNNGDCDGLLQRVEAMAAVNAERTQFPDAAALLAAIDDILDLHVAFCRAYGLGAKQARRRRRQLRRRLSIHLVSFAKHHSGRNRAAARALLRRAVQVYWPAVLKARTLRTATRLILI